MTGLPWYRRDVASRSHPKILELLTMRDGFRTYFVWDSGLGYAVEHGTDGVIRRAVLPQLMGRRSDAERLVKVGLWEEHPDGWRIHDFPDYQRSSQVSEAIRDAQSTGGAKAMCRRWHGPDCGCWSRGGLRSV